MFVLCLDNNVLIMSGSDLVPEKFSRKSTKNDEILYNAWKVFTLCYTLQSRNNLNVHLTCVHILDKKILQSLKKKTIIYLKTFIQQLYVSQLKSHLTVEEDSEGEVFPLKNIFCQNNNCCRKQQHMHVCVLQMSHIGTSGGCCSALMRSSQIFPPVCSSPQTAAYKSSSSSRTFSLKHMHIYKHRHTERNIHTENGYHATVRQGQLLCIIVYGTIQWKCMLTISAFSGRM